MRTRIALGAAAFAVACIVVSSLVTVSLVASAARAGTAQRGHDGAHTGAAGSRAVTLAARRTHDAREARPHRAVDTSGFVRVVRSERAIRFGQLLTQWWLALAPQPPSPAPTSPQPPASAPTAVVSLPSPVTDSTSTTTPDWACIRLHESSDRFNTPGVPGGAYGFLEMTWLSLGYSGWPYEAPYSVQSQAALYLHNELGWQPWSTRVVCDL